MRVSTIAALGATIGLAFLLQGCGDVSSDGTNYPETERISRGGTDAYDRSSTESVFGKGGIDIFGGNSDGKMAAAEAAQGLL